MQSTTLDASEFEGDWEFSSGKFFRFSKNDGKWVVFSYQDSKTIPATVSWEKKAEKWKLIFGKVNCYLIESGKMTYAVDKFYGTAKKI